MSDSPEREMTLDEWVNRLPDIHLAHKQYTQLKDQLSKYRDRYILGDAIRIAYLKHGNDSWCSIADDVIEALSQLGEDNGIYSTR